MTVREKLSNILLSAHPCADFERAYRAGELQELADMLPEIEACFAQEQESEWHIYNVMEHILRSVEEMNSQTVGMSYGEREFLAYVMFFHDLGKPSSRRVIEVGGALRESFRGHNLCSERVAARALPRLGFDEKEARAICKLVREHDVFLSFSDAPTQPWQIAPTAQYFAGLRAELDGYGDGRRLLDMLFMVGIADNRAQNPLLTAAPLEYIARLRERASSA